VTAQVGALGEKLARQQLLSDPHSPNEFRITTVRNCETRYKAFDVQEGDTM